MQVNVPYKSSILDSGAREQARRARTVCLLGLYCCTGFCYCCCNVNFCAFIAITTRKNFSLSLYHNCCHPLPFALSSVFSSLFSTAAEFFLRNFSFSNFFSNFFHFFATHFVITFFLGFVVIVAYIHIYSYRQSRFNTSRVSPSHWVRVWWVEKKVSQTFLFLFVEYNNLLCFSLHQKFST